MKIEEKDLLRLISLIEQELLSTLELEGTDSNDPVRVHHIPKDWKLLGAGNYAAVLYHSDYESMAVKVYAPGREGWENEREVYRRLGDHPAYSACHHSAQSKGASYLILRRLRGKTLYQCLMEGKPIPPGVIQDIDEALEYARKRGLNPHDVHGKNTMVSGEGKGLVVDISDFLKDEPCSMWHDLKKAYDRVYTPFLSKNPVPIPEWMMNSIRKGYRWTKSFSRGSRQS
ncbi:serine/threonine protein kinase [Paenibacillus sp. NEAU-GSW1]|uniref:serine/threonine protein kinase n=1 Tax=Paenibacillus sp. NEAU-GSW1 TaxID=2682486 RepID=UPI0012E0E0E6|nr:serine/threonine protein kinase [Paenibacillus sp. NEAU-GSW1]MUT65116.1 serine/threonine protein kinase [Paenibacillus sp. NEAU-GSW1]